MSKALPRTRAVRDLVSVISPIFRHQKPFTSHGTCVFLCEPTPPYTEPTYRDLFERTKVALLAHLKDHPIIEQSDNHVMWVGDGESFHFLLSRGCRGTMSVEVRAGLKSL